MTLKETIQDWWEFESGYWFRTWSGLDLLESCKYWVAHRSWDKYHVIKSELPPGYYETDTRMLYGCFALLVDYVEIEMAWQLRWWLSADIQKNFKFKKGRCAKLGLLALESRCMSVGEIPEIEFVAPIKEPSFDNVWAAQTVLYKEIKDLYLWWTVERPIREDSETITYVTTNDGVSLVYADEEDTDMLKRLMVIRTSLWT